MKAGILDNRITGRQDDWTTGRLDKRTTGRWDETTARFHPSRFIPHPSQDNRTTATSPQDNHVNGSLLRKATKLTVFRPGGCPEGTTDNSPAFQRGVQDPMASSPEGTAERRATKSHHNATAEACDNSPSSLSFHPSSLQGAFLGLFTGALVACSFLLAPRNAVARAGHFFGGPMEFHDATDRVCPQDAYGANLPVLPKGRQCDGPRHALLVGERAVREPMDCG